MDVAAATERLFQEIADSTGSDLIKQSMAMINQRLHTIRPYEAALFSDREAEFEALLDAWRRRDKAGLQQLLIAYFNRREEAAGKLVNLINRPN